MVFLHDRGGYAYILQLAAQEEPYIFRVDGFRDARGCNDGAFAEAGSDFLDEFIESFFDPSG